MSVYSCCLAISCVLCPHSLYHYFSNCPPWKSVCLGVTGFILACLLKGGYYCQYFSLLRIRPYSFSKLVFHNKIFTSVVNSLFGRHSAISISGCTVGYCCHFLLIVVKQSKEYGQIFLHYRAGCCFSKGYMTVAVAYQHCVKLLAVIVSMYLYEIVLAFLFCYGTATILHLCFMSSLKG